MRKFQPHQPAACADFRSDMNAAIAELDAAGQGRSVLSGAIIRPCSLHDENGRMLYFNTGAAELLHLSSDADTACILDAFHLHDRVEAASFFAGDGIVSGQGATIECRLKRRGKDSSDKHWLELTRTGFTGEHSGHAFTLITYRDISRAKLQELNATALQQETAHANEAKTRFLANISHELRTPLNAILGFSELLNSPLAVSFDDAKRIEYIDLIHDSARHLLNLLNSILDMSKIENGMYEIFPESFDLRRCIENSAAIMVGQAAPRGVDIRCSGLESLPKIVGDERAVRQVLINLLSNAIKFSDDGGVVTLSAVRKARSVELVIADNGVGISEEHLKDLGKPFFQADSKYDRKYEGTGLGLSIVRGLVELHNGTTRFESIRGQGTRVTIALPLNCKPAKQVPAKETVVKVLPLAREVPFQDELPSENTLKVLRNSA